MSGDVAQFKIIEKSKRIFAAIIIFRNNKYMFKSQTNVSKEYTYTAPSKCTVYTVYFYSLALSSLLKILVEKLMPVRLIWMFLFSNVEKCLQKLLISY